MGQQNVTQSTSVTSSQLSRTAFAAAMASCEHMMTTLPCSDTRSSTLEKARKSPVVVRRAKDDAKGLVFVVVFDGEQLGAGP